VPGLDYLAAIQSEADALVSAARTAGVDAPVPSCPEWSVSDLLGHIGGVHRWAAANAAREPDQPRASLADLGIEAPADTAARPEWVAAGARELVAALDRPPETPAWTWTAPATIGFWQRREAHETAMHRVDAQLAAGSVAPVDAALAADGIDEWLALVPNRPWADPITGGGETIHLHCTDVEGEWLIRLAATGLEVERVHAKGDVAARGAASDLLRWVMGRGDVGALEVFGDEGLLTRWRDVARF
jgi:uncharacterized protein (TIGR03083 family)